VRRAVEDKFGALAEFELVRQFTCAKNSLVPAEPILAPPAPHGETSQGESTHCSALSGNDEAQLIASNSPDGPPWAIAPFTSGVMSEVRVKSPSILPKIKEGSAAFRVLAAIEEGYATPGAIAQRTKLCGEKTRRTLQALHKESLVFEGPDGKLMNNRSLHHPSIYYVEKLPPAGEDFGIIP
jgi:hypothetical protein